MTSSARTMRRPFVGRILAAAAGSAARRRSYSGAGPSAASAASSDARSSASVPGNSNSSSTARTYSPDPPTRIGTRPRARTSSTAARATRWYAATLAGSVTSQMSSTWCGTPARSAGVSLAVPMSIPR
jgi:hypothetical protein